MADNEELKGLQDLFDADSSEDMEEFMNMLNSIDIDEDPLAQEMESTDTDFVEEQFVGFQEDFSEEEQTEDITAFIPEEDNIMNLLESVGTEEIPMDHLVVDESVEAGVAGLEDVLAKFEGQEAASATEVVEKESFIQRIKGKFNKPLTEEELRQREQEEEEERIWEEQKKAEAEAKKAEANEKKQAKKEEAEKKKQEKVQKKEALKSVKLEKKEAKRQAKEAKKGPVPKSQIVPKKPIFVGVILAAAFSVLFVTFTNYTFYSASIDDSKELFIHQKYKEAYEELLGLEIKQKDETFYSQVRTVRMVDKNLDAYNSFVKARDYEKALEALIKGVGKYHELEAQAKELSLEKEMYGIYEEIIKELTVRFGMTTQEAKDLYTSKDKTQYQTNIEQIAREAAIKDGILEVEEE